MTAPSGTDRAGAGTASSDAGAAPPPGPSGADAGAAPPPGPSGAAAGAAPPLGPVRPVRPVRLDPSDVRRSLREAGLHARHALSQNFLADLDVLEAILAEAAPTAGRAVLEIGPGLGILTGGLLEAGAAVSAVELDHGLAERLRIRFAEPIAAAAEQPGAARSLRLIEGDALDQPLTRLCPPPYDVVANLPYHITSPILHRLLEAPPRPERSVLMVQREVAERIAAPPGKMSYLSVFVQYHARVRIALRVPPSAFEPAPEVDSAVIVIEPFAADDRLDPATEDALWRLVQASFRERRKMLHNVLVRQLGLPAERVAAALAGAGIEPDRRPQTLGVGEWLRLLETIGPIGPDARGRTAAGER
jgi:16S rRNA (adenine1518-N6/adenine1519-N6)-dimethyltransferase